MVSWQHLKQQLAQPLNTGMLGTWTLARPRRDDGRGWPPASLARSVMPFARQPPGKWRLDAGRHKYVRIDESQDDPAPGQPGLWFAPGPYPWDFRSSPLRLTRPLGSPTLDAARPANEPSPVTHDGRPGWSVILDCDLPEPLHLVIDDQAGIVLLAECSSSGYQEQFTGLEFPRTVSDELIGPIRDNAAEKARFRRLHEYCRTRPLPLPDGWPEPILSPIVNDGDPETGFLVINLGGTRTGPGPVGAWLIRQPPDDAAYEDYWLTNNPDHYVHRWQSRNWQWTLAVRDRPLTPDELHDVISTTPET